MANEILDDHEQAEVVRKWIADNGPAIVVGIVLGLGGLSGYRYWEDRQYEARMAAASEYETLIETLNQDESEASLQQLNEYAGSHDNPAYEGLAALQLAAKALEDRNLDEAATLYRRASESAEPAALRQVAGMRLARIQLQNGQMDQALATVDRHDGPGFEAIAAQIRGDILLARGDREAAREAFQFALDNGAGDRSLLQMKIDDLSAQLALQETSPDASLTEPVAPGPEAADEPGSEADATETAPAPEAEDEQSADTSDDDDDDDSGNPS